MATMAAVLTDRRARLQTTPLRHLDVVLRRSRRSLITGSGC